MAVRPTRSGPSRRRSDGRRAALWAWASGRASGAGPAADSRNALSYCDQKYPELVTIPSGLISERAYYTCTSDRKHLYPMITYEQDSDIHHWGFDFLHCDLFSVPPYCGGTSQQDSSFYDTSYVGEGDIDPECATIENDEIIAHALQEELSQLAVAEASGSTHAEDECLQVSVLTQDWFSPYMRSYSSGNEGGQDEADDMEPSSSCSSPGENSYKGEEWSLELTDDFSDIEGEVGKRLNHMVSIPHVPRINGEIPSVDEATSDHQRLIDRLQMYDLVELKVQGDGNCQFRALSDQFYRSPEHHKFVRQQVLNQLKTHPEFYEGYVPMEYGDYLKKLSKSGEWGDHVTLQAAADSYGVKIFVITSFKDTCYIEILPSIQKSKRVIFLSFWAEVHYNSIYPEGALVATKSSGSFSPPLANRPLSPLLLEASRSPSLLQIARQDPLSLPVFFF
ncbi:OTU-like cysteine protease [Musa troglodytarum]|uniref:ubiquitinyl hydrolase 1 n=1 Tax=Musa troglodytarum TaxID=320322 RepID=A0A9E7F1Q0_9LILI|nr:OTU-like cysteine protease [Musa troglodytarum]